jgi:hypothetical protein
MSFFQSSWSPRRKLYAWLVFAFFVQIVFQIHGGTNPRSRGAALVALVEEGSLRIDSYVHYTVDWSQTPDGHFYSNKAPGPVFIAFPLFWALDRIQTWGVTNRLERDQIRERRINGNMRLLSWLLQVLPFLFVAMLWCRYLERQTVSLATRILSLCALLFGNTASVTMNSYFGHGLASIFMLLCLLAVCQRQIGLAAFAFGWAALSDYGAAVYALPLAVLLWKEAREIGWISAGKQIVLGAALPAVLWVAYHSSAFGGPFTLPFRFQNPVFVDKASETIHLWGVLGLPSGAILFELLFGYLRGILWTQPWVFVVLSASVLLLLRRIPQSLSRPIAVVAAGFVLLLCMNASFGGWHGGASPGPRYLSVGLVLFAPILGLVGDRLSPTVSAFAWITVTLGAVCGLFILSAYDFPADNQSVWSFIWSNLTVHHPGTALLRLGVSLPILFWLLLVGYRARTHR